MKINLSPIHTLASELSAVLKKISIINAWMADYNTMQEQMIYGDTPSFDQMIDAIKDFTVNKINQLEWKMDVEFPKP